MFYCQNQKGPNKSPSRCDYMCTCANIKQGLNSETPGPYLDVLYHIHCVGYLFHVSVLDSFDTDSCQVDLAFEV